jgi:prolyl-tRNA editing enzyme YbaK/EbsC (Cys-tRNA(Pro) deacylase)
LSLNSGQYSETLRAFLVSHEIWHRFIDFDEPVKTVEQAARKVAVDLIAKSIILVDSNNLPLLIILNAKNRISYRKVKELAGVKDVRLADEREVLAYSGYPVGGVPPFNQIRRAFLDRRVLQKDTAIVGGGDINKLVEIRTKDLVENIHPVIADLSREIG